MTRSSLAASPSVAAQSLARAHQHLHDRRLASVNFRCHGMNDFKSNLLKRSRITETLATSRQHESG